MNAASRAKTPTTLKRTVARGRRPNAHYRTREYLTEREVERLMKAAGNNRHGHRDATMILLAFRHGHAGLGTVLAALGSGRPCQWPPARLPRQERDGLRASTHGQRASGAATIAAGARTRALCVHERAWGADE